MKKNSFLYPALFIFCLIFVPIVVLSQGGGIRFENHLLWSAILKKAEAERKYIFVDCYATWCAPCKYMNQKIFTQSSVGDFFNANFINVSVQMDRTSNDSESVKAWYPEANFIGEKYSVKAYPTYLVFSPEGVPLDRFIGSFEATEFINRAKDVLKPKERYYTIVNDYKNHLSDSGYLQKALSMAIASSDNMNAARIADYYLLILRDSFSIGNIQLLTQVITPSSSRLFHFFLKNAHRIDDILESKDEIENMLCRYIRDERVEPLFKNAEATVDCKEVFDHLKNEFPSLDSTLPFWIDECFSHFIGIAINAAIYSEGSRQGDWGIIAQKMSIRFPGYDCTILIDEAKPGYYKNKKMWPQCEKSALSLFDRYGDKLSAGDINRIVWNYLFMYSSDLNVLNIACKWSKRSVDMDSSCQYMDTYANLLFKIGEREDALQWEKRATDQCGDNDEIRSNLEKMKNGVRTWAEIEK